MNRELEEGRSVRMDQHEVKSALRHPPTPRRQVLVIVAAVATLVREIAAGWCLEPRPRVCTEFCRSAAVFSGRVVSARAVSDKNGQVTGTIYRLVVLRKYRGVLRSEVDIYDENASTRWPMKVRRAYLIFAYKGSNGLEVYSCGNSIALEKSAEVIREIAETQRMIRQANAGSIRGRVQEQVGTDLGVAGVGFNVVGEQKSFKVVSGSGGWFLLSVPPGTYRIVPISGAWSVTAYDLSFDDPNEVTVSSGCGAEVLFQASRP